LNSMFCIRIASFFGNAFILLLYHGDCNYFLNYQIKRIHKLPLNM
jgi:hypothetical protein